LAAEALGQSRAKQEAQVLAGQVLAPFVLHRCRDVHPYFGAYTGRVEHKWRVEKKDVWAFPITENSGVYGIRIENTGLGFIENPPDWGVEPEEFVWAEHVDLAEFNARTESQWLELLESWLADPDSDASFSLRIFTMDTLPTQEVDKEAICFERGDMKLFEACVQASLLLDEEWMRAVEHENETSLAGKSSKFGVIVRFNEEGVLDFSLWPASKLLNEEFPHVLERVRFLIEWFGPRRDEPKIARYTALRRRIIGQPRPHQIIIDYVPRPLASHERDERIEHLNHLLFGAFSPREAAALMERIAPTL